MTLGGTHRRSRIGARSLPASPRSRGSRRPLSIEAPQRRFDSPRDRTWRREGAAGAASSRHGLPGTVVTAAPLLSRPLAPGLEHRLGRPSSETLSQRGLAKRPARAKDAAIDRRLGDPQRHVPPPSGKIDEFPRQSGRPLIQSLPHGNGFLGVPVCPSVEGRTCRPVKGGPDDNPMAYICQCEPTCTSCTDVQRRETYPPPFPLRGPPILDA